MLPSERPHSFFSATGAGARAARAVALVAFVAAAACGGQSCSCLAPIKGGFPTAERKPRAIQVRATQGLFQFVGANAPQLVPKLLPTGSQFNVPPQCSGNTQICCGNPAPMCRISFDFRTLSLVPTSPDKVVLDLSMVIKTLDNLPVDIFGTTCNVSLDTTRAGGQTMRVQGDLQFSINQGSDDTQLALNNATISGLDDGDVNFNEPGSSLACSIGNVSFIKTQIINLLNSQLASQVQSQVSSATCMACKTIDDCNGFAAQCKSGQCQFSDGKCVQELGASGRLDVSKSLASFGAPPTARLDILAALGDYAIADSGLSLGMIGGATSPAHDPCVPKVAAPNVAPPAQSPTFQTDVTPDGKPYHLGIGVHRAHLDRFGWAAFDGGALCLKVGTPTAAQLNGGTLGLVIPSLQDLTHGDPAPVYVALRPQAPPTFELGAGTFKTDSNGMRVVDDPLLWVSLPDLEVDFYVFVEDRYVRVMTLVADAKLPVSLDIGAGGKLVPILGDLASAFKHVRVTNTKLVAESPDDLAQVFPTLLGAAGGQLLNGVAPLALPSIMGLNVSPKTITTTDPDAGGARQFLAIFSDLSLAAGGMRHLPAVHVTTRATLSSLELPSTAEFAVSARSGRQPTARVRVEAGWAGPEPLEASFRVDGGTWSAWTPLTDGRGELVVTHPVLWLEGHHQLEVRARAVGLPDSVDGRPVAIELLVDTQPPHGQLRIEGSEAIVDAHDLVSPDAALRYRFSFDGGRTFGALGAAARADIPAGAGAGDVVVQVLDEAGQLGTFRVPGAEAHGCAAVPGARTGGSGWLLLVLAFVVVARRRAALAVVALVAFGASACSGLGKADFEDPIDEVGRWLDAAAHETTVHLSAYDTTYGDLVYARLEKPGDPPAWQVVDGVDLGSPIDKKGGYRAERSDPGPDVGLYTSIALTRDGRPRIAYHDATNRGLKLALGPGKFQTHTIEAGGSDGPVTGLYAALTLDDHDIPTVAYMVTGISDGQGGFRSELRVARASRAEPSGASDWTIRVVDQTAVPCAGLCPGGQACVEDAMVNGMPNGDPARSHCKPVATGCPSTCSSSQACVGGACVSVLTVGTPDWPEGIGLWTQARRASGGTLTLVYHDRSQGDLKLAAEQGDGSFVTTFIDGNSAQTDVGQFCAADFGTDGVLHVAYVDAISDQLLYKAISGGAVPMQAEVIDDGVRDDGRHPLGATALAVDGTTPRVVYQDEATADLLEAQRSGGWQRGMVTSGPAGSGFYPRLVRVGGALWVAQLVYDRELTQKPLGRVQLTQVP